MDSIEIIISSSNSFNHLNNHHAYYYVENIRFTLFKISG
jgi:hypothetical protein